MTDETNEPAQIAPFPPFESGAPSAAKAPGFWSGSLIIAKLELTQRLRSTTLWVLAIVWFVLIAIVTFATWGLLSVSYGPGTRSVDTYPLFGMIVYFVLLFGTLVAPAISAGSISSERSGGTLATTQVTLIGTWAIIFGKTLAAWLTGLALLLVASPFVILSLLLSQTSPLQLFMALLALALQLLLFTAMGVGLSALITSPLFAIVTAYLLVALLSVGTLIAFGLSYGVSTRYEETEYRTFSEQYWEEYWQCKDGDNACYEAIPVTCVTETISSSYTPTDKLWWILAMNPYVVVGDMVSVRGDLDSLDDPFSTVSYIVRQLQIPSATADYSDCPTSSPQDPEDSETIGDELAGTIPVWWVGLILQFVIAGGLLWAGYRRLDTPAAKLPRGTRVA